MIVSFLSINKQSDTYNCGPFAITFAAEVADGKSPLDVAFDTQNMLQHLIQCLA